MSPAAISQERLDPDDRCRILSLTPINRRNARRRLCASLLAAASMAATAPARAAPHVPIPDPGFGDPDGIARIAFDVVPDGWDAAKTSLVADGKLVLAGVAQVDADQYDLAFVRLDATGTPDPGFGSGGNGRVLAGMAPIYRNGHVNLAQSPDGRLLYVAQTTDAGTTTVVGRRNGDGSADTSFNGSGHRFFSAGFFVDGGDTVFLARILPLTDGKMLVLGVAGTNTPLHACQAVARLHAGGATDTGFGGGRGSVCHAPVLSGSPSVNWSLDGLVLDDGGILLAGFAAHSGGSGYDMSVTRLLPDGQLDTGFGPGHDGWAFVGFDQGGALTDAAAAMAIDGQGRIVIAGVVERQTGYDIGVARLLPSGEADPSFGLDGRIQLGLSFSGVDFYSFSVHALADGRILIGSQFIDENGAGLAAMLAADGQLDPRFGDGGIFRQAADDAPTTSVVATAQVLLDDDHLYMVGSNGPSWSVGANRDFAATRYVLPLFRSGFE